MAACVQSVVAIVILCAVWKATAHQCVARAWTEAGWVCGVCAPGDDYASFLAVPYARQPLAELRFQELQQPDPWEGCRDATQQGPICPQRDLFYGPLMRKSEMSEECIHANVYVPLGYLPEYGDNETRTLLPVLVHIHGGGFGFGSGDPDFHGPQYLVRDNIVVITFNYRVGPFGFLSLNSSSIPGNAGLRDMVTLLRWVQRNVKYFGGDPDNVTLSGQSAGAASVHLLSMSRAAEGLFNKAILMSGTGVRNFFSTSPAYAQFVAQAFLTGLGINTTDPEEAHRQLIATPLARIMDVHNYLQDTTGLLVFTPVVESIHPGVEPIVDEDPEVLQAQGRGKDIPFIVGFTNAECQTFRPRFEAIDIMGRIKKNPVIMLPAAAIYMTPPEQVAGKIGQMSQRYFNGTANLNKFLRLCSDSYFVYPALKVAEARAAVGGAPVYLYRFAYEADYSVFQKALKLKYRGAGHSEDLTFVFRANEFLGERALSARDIAMTDAMTTYVTNFMEYSDPTNGVRGWPPVRNDRLQYQHIVSPDLISTDASTNHRAMMKFFDSIYSVES